MGWLKNLIGNTAGEVIGTVGETVDRFVTTDQERAEAQLELQKLELKFRKLEMDAEQAYLEDRQSAREMYMHDSSLQKIFAMTFLVGYLAITGVMLYFVLTWLNLAVAPEIPAWGVSLISTVFGAMSSKVNTIVDFLFGGSQGERDSAQKMQESFKSASQQRQNSAAQ